MTVMPNGQLVFSSWWRRLLCRLGRHRERLSAGWPANIIEHTVCPDCGRDFLTNHAIDATLPWDNPRKRKYEFRGYNGDRKRRKRMARHHDATGDLARLKAGLSS